MEVCREFVNNYIDMVKYLKRGLAVNVDVGDSREPESLRGVAITANKHDLEMEETMVVWRIVHEGPGIRIYPQGVVQYYIARTNKDFLAKLKH